MEKMSYGFTECAICQRVIRYGPSVVAGVKNGEPTGYAHADCWVNSGREVIYPVVGEDGVIRASRTHYW